MNLLLPCWLHKTPGRVSFKILGTGTGTWFSFLFYKIGPSNIISFSGLEYIFLTAPSNDVTMKSCRFIIIRPPSAFLSFNVTWHYSPVSQFNSANSDGVTTPQIEALNQTCFILFENRTEPIYLGAIMMLCTVCEYIPTGFKRRGISRQKRLVVVSFPLWKEQKAKHSHRSVLFPFSL